MDRLKRLLRHPTMFITLIIIQAVIIAIYSTVLILLNILFGYPIDNKIIIAAVTLFVLIMNGRTIWRSI